MPEHPVILSPAQIEELNKKLRQMRHDINNHLTLIVAATELIRGKPDTTERMLGTVLDQVPRVTGALAEFSAQFENTLDIKRG